MVKKAKVIDFVPGKTFTTGEVAKLCGVSLRTVINWIKQGKLQAFQLPGARGDNRISYESVVEFMEAHQIPLPKRFPDEKRNALVVDDDPRMANAIARILKGSGFETQIAENGFQAGAKFVEFKPVLVTLDLQMPKMDGFAVLDQLGQEPNVVVCVISGMGRDALDLAISKGAHYALAKPFDNAALVEIAEHCLE